MAHKRMTANGLGIPSNVWAEIDEEVDGDWSRVWVRGPGDLTIYNSEAAMMKAQLRGTSKPPQRRRNAKRKVL